MKIKVYLAGLSLASIITPASAQLDEVDWFVFCRAADLSADAKTYQALYSARGYDRSDWRYRHFIQHQDDMFNQHIKANYPKTVGHGSCSASENRAELERYSAEDRQRFQGRVVTLEYNRPKTPPPSAPPANNKVVQ